MGSFIQGRMVLPFQLERTENLFLSSSRRETAAGPAGESLDYIHSFTQTRNSKKGLLQFALNQHREMLTSKCSNFILQGPVQFISPVVNWRNTKDLCPQKMRNTYLYLCHFIKHCLVTGLRTLSSTVHIYFLSNLCMLHYFNGF